MIFLKIKGGIVVEVNEGRRKREPDQQEGRSVGPKSEPN